MLRESRLQGDFRILVVVIRLRGKCLICTTAEVDKVGQHAYEGHEGIMISGPVLSNKPQMVAEKGQDADKEQSSHEKQKQDVEFGMRTKTLRERDTSLRRSIHVRHAQAALREERVAFLDEEGEEGGEREEEEAKAEEESGETERLLVGLLLGEPRGYSLSPNLPFVHVRYPGSVRSEKLQKVADEFSRLLLPLVDEVLALLFYSVDKELCGKGPGSVPHHLVNVTAVPQGVVAFVLCHHRIALKLVAQRCEEFTDLNLSHAFIGTSLKVRLLLYTRDNGTCGTLVSHTDLSAHPQFNLSRPTTFVIHGYRLTGSPPVWVRQIPELLLAREDLNVIVVDWNHGAANVNYLKAVENAYNTANNLTAFIKMLQGHGASLSSIHMIGVSLGAHISGLIGANLNGLLGRITALDPAGPQFTGNPPERRLDPTDAQFVDVLHTDIDALGFREPLGHIDFYANGGADQPGCPKTIFSGYDVTDWKEVLLRLGQTKTYFTTNADSPFCKTNYRLEVMIWNKNVQWGYITVKLHGNGKEAVATIDHKAPKFKKYTETNLLAQFDKDLQSVEKVSLTFSSSNVLKPKYKLRVLRIRLTHLERKERPLCRYDILLEENKAFTFRPISCEESNF
ncbi:hypothetical protein FQN60_000823 [Etheostoma spectabile]|uniref:Lipase domain-containing protein n=1 Tax=Etheostoma spectabile TaxID=54343 RepID=A0A5J5CZA5_9PERO|nr:hypothetical protein FQN60_000823 [Etheostoma spectabile]